MSRINRDEYDKQTQKSDKKSDMQFSFNNIIAIDSLPISPKSLAISRRTSLIRNFDSEEASPKNIPRTKSQQKKCILKIHKKVFEDIQKMTVTNLQNQRIEKSTQYQNKFINNIEQNLLPFRRIEKNGEVQCISNHILILLRMSQMLKTIFESRNQNSCLQCIVGKRPAENCRQIGYFEALDYKDLIENFTYFGIKDCLQRDAKLSVLENEQVLLKNMDLIFNHDCDHPKFQRAVKRLIDTFNSTKKQFQSKNESKRARFNNSLPKLMNSYNARVEFSKRFRLDNKIRFSLAPARKDTLDKAKAPKSKRKKKKELLSKESFKEFSQKMVKWYMSRRIHTLKHQANSIYIDRSAEHFFQNLFLNGFEKTEVILIDCRYQYEFDGGHVPGAFNICDPAVVAKLFFNHGWINSIEFLEHLREFRDEYLDDEKANEILEKYEKKLFLRRIQRRQEKAKHFGKKKRRSKSFGLREMLLSSQVNDRTRSAEKQAKLEHQFIEKVVSPRSRNIASSKNNVFCIGFNNINKKELDESQSIEPDPFTLDSKEIDSLVESNNPTKDKNIFSELLSLEAKSKRSIPQEKGVQKSACVSEAPRMFSERKVNVGAYGMVVPNKQMIFDEAVKESQLMYNTLISNKFGNLESPKKKKKKKISVYGHSKTFGVNAFKSQVPKKIDVVVVFYCEFSSERAPKMYNYFRYYDRLNNIYPKLYYPNIFLMEKGYADFHQKFKYFCSKPLKKKKISKAPKKRNYFLEKLGRKYIQSSNVISEKSSEVNEFKSIEHHNEVYGTFGDGIPHSNRALINSNIIPFFGGNGGVELIPKPKLTKHKKSFSINNHDLRFHLNQKLKSPVDKDLPKKKVRVKRKRRETWQGKSKTSMFGLKKSTFQKKMPKRKVPFKKIKSHFLQTKKKRPDLKKIFNSLRIGKGKILIPRLPKIEMFSVLKKGFFNKTLHTKIRAPLQRSLVKDTKSFFKQKTKKKKSKKPKKFQKLKRRGTVFTTNKSLISMKRSLGSSLRSSFDFTNMPKKMFRKIKIKKKTLTSNFKEKSVKKKKKKIELELEIKPVVSILSSERYITMDNPSYNDNLMICKKLYRDKWKALHQERKMLSLNRTLSQQ